MSKPPADILHVSWRRCPNLLPTYYMFLGAHVQTSCRHTTCFLAPMSKPPTAHTGLFQKIFNLYFLMLTMVLAKIESVKKTLIYISVFRWRSRSSRNYFSQVRTKAVASASRKKHCAILQYVSIQQQEDEFPEALHDLVDVNFEGLHDS